MPLLINPSGRYVVVSEELANSLLYSEAEVRDPKGKLIRAGFKSAETPEHRAAYAKEVKAAEEAVAAEEARRMAVQESGAAAIAKAFMGQLKGKKGE